MRIAIVGAASEGKSHFVDHVLFPALLRDENRGFVIIENGLVTARRAGSPTTIVATFRNPEEAAKWLKQS